MVPRRSPSQITLLVLTLLSACAASDFGLDDAPGRSSFKPTGAYGAYLSGRYAAHGSDLNLAAEKLELAARDSGVSEVEVQAFIAAVMAGRPEATQMAARLPDNPVAQLVTANADAKAGRWDDAIARYSGLPQQGLTQVLRPILVAWSQQGAGRTSAALGTLQPFIDGGRLRAVMALHAALIADQGGLTADATRLYRTAQVDFGGLSLRLGIIEASWQARQGYVTEGQRIIQDLTAGSGDLVMARLPLEADVSNKAVRNATDGLAEAYLAMGATLRQQNANETAQVLLQLALSMRPDLTAARLLLADIEESAKRFSGALDTLGPVTAADPLVSLVRLRQANLQDQLGHTAEAAQLLEELAREYPTRPEPLAQLGDMERRAGHMPQALALYDRAIARLGTPSRANWPLFYARGVTRERAGQWPAAESDFEYALRLSPDQASVLNYLGYAWAEQDRNLPEARAMIQKAVDQQPNEGSFIDSLGWIMLKQGDNPAALKNLERAVELQPEDPVVNGHLGDALAAAGRLREADFQWRRALTLKPDVDEAKRINDRLASLKAAAR